MSIKTIVHNLIHLRSSWERAVKVTSGDLSALNLSEFYIVEKLHSGKDQAALPSRDPELAKLINSKNRTEVLPSLIAALRGDAEARKYYEGARLFHYSVLPDWARDEIWQTVQFEYKNFDSTGPVILQTRTSQKLKGSRTPFNQDIFDSLSLNVYLTFQKAMNTLEALDQIEIKIPELEIVDSETTRTLSVSNLFHPLSSDPGGIAARRALRRVFPMMFNTIVLTDLAISIGLDIKDESGRKLIHQFKDPWKIASCRLVRNTLLITDYFQRLRNSDNSGINVDSIYSTCVVRFCNSSDPIKRINEFIASLKGSDKEDKRSHPVAPKESLASLKGQFFDAIYSLLDANGFRGTSKEQYARELYKLYQRGATSFEEIAVTIASGRSLPAFLEDGNRRLLGNAAEKSNDRTNGKAVTEKERGTSKNKQTTERFTLEHFNDDGKIPFIKWLDRLDPVNRARIEDRLENFKIGLFGDHKIVRNGIYEARSFAKSAPGMRIYFLRLPENRIILLCGGFKDNQHDDLDQAEALYQKFKKRGYEPA